MTKRAKLNWWDDLTFLRRRLATCNSQGRKYGFRPIKLDVLLQWEGLCVKDCYWCHRPLVKPRISFDHFIPLSYKDKLSGHNVDNLVVTCRSCNFHRGATPAQHWRDFIEMLIQKGWLIWFKQSFRRSKWRRS